MYLHYFIIIIITNYLVCPNYRYPLNIHGMSGDYLYIRDVGTIAQNLRGILP